MEWTPAFWSLGQDIPDQDAVVTSGKEVASTIRATDDPDQLDACLNLVVTAQTRDDMGIGVPA
jgi:hypothetical protein